MTADKPELGGETGRMSPKHAPYKQNPFIIREIRDIRGSYSGFRV